MLSRLRTSSSYKWWVFAAIAIGTFVSVIDAGSVLVALPEIEEILLWDENADALADTVESAGDKVTAAFTDLMVTDEDVDLELLRRRSAGKGEA